MFDRLVEDLRVVAERDPAIRSRWEAILYPHIHALWLHRRAHRLAVAGHPVVARAVALFGRLVSGGIDIHPNAHIGARLFIDHGSAVTIGAGAVIEDDVTIYQQVTIGSRGFGFPVFPGVPSRSGRYPRIGAGSVVGANASILGPVVVAPSSLIPAHSLITRDFPEPQPDRRNNLTSVT